VKATQHIPTFFEGLEPESAKVNSLEELEALEFIKRWRAMPGFDHFSVAWDGTLLMAEFADKSFWVVAYLDGDCGPVVGLPKWRDTK
jgi:hypothetical protein